MYNICIYMQCAAWANKFYMPRALGFNGGPLGPVWQAPSVTSCAGRIRASAAPGYGCGCRTARCAGRAAPGRLRARTLTTRKRRRRRMKMCLGPGPQRCGACWRVTFGDRPPKTYACKGTGMRRGPSATEKTHGLF